MPASHVIFPLERCRGLFSSCLALSHLARLFRCLADHELRLPPFSSPDLITTYSSCQEALLSNFRHPIRGGSSAPCNTTPDHVHVHILRLSYSPSYLITHPRVPHPCSPMFRLVFQLFNRSLKRQNKKSGKLQENEQKHDSSPLFSWFYPSFSFRFVTTTALGWSCECSLFHLRSITW
jgi:hypothetical protein